MLSTHDDASRSMIRKKISLARFELATFALHNLLHWSNYKNDTLAAASQGLVATVQFSNNMLHYSIDAFLLEIDLPCRRALLSSSNNHNALEVVRSHKSRTVIKWKSKPGPKDSMARSGRIREKRKLLSLQIAQNFCGSPKSEASKQAFFFLFHGNSTKTGIGSPQSW